MAYAEFGFMSNKKGIGLLFPNYPNNFTVVRKLNNNTTVVHTNLNQCTILFFLNMFDTSIEVHHFNSHTFIYCKITNLILFVLAIEL